jgi:hypothetical protein
VKQIIRVKQYPRETIETEAKKSLDSIFSVIPFLEIKDSKTNVRFGNKVFDIVVSALLSGKLAKFVFELKTQAEPRFVRMAAAQMKDFLQNSENFYGILVAPYFSYNSRQICKEAGVGCVDLAGNAYLSFRNIFIDKSGIANPFSTARVSKSIFFPKSSRILRVLLTAPSRRWTVENISQESGISIGLASRVKQALLAEEWIKEENRRFFLAKPEEALDQWSKNYTYEKNRLFFFYSGLTEEQIEAGIKKECNRKNYRYGLALFSGARKIAPFVRFLRFFSYIDGNIEDIADALKLKKVESGANVTLLQPYDDGVFYGLQDINCIKVVSDIQLYLDLKSYKGRGEEAAQAIFEQRIRPKW